MTKSQIARAVQDIRPRDRADAIQDLIQSDEIQIRKERAGNRGPLATIYVVKNYSLNSFDSKMDISH